MFRALSHQLFNTDEHHSSVRLLLQRFENLNPSKFTPFLMSINKPTFEEHIRHIGTPQTWGTHIEVLAVATYYKFPVYFLNKKRGEEVFKWNVIKPLCTDNMSYPFLVEEDGFLASTEATHIEIVYYCSHYNSITCLDTDRASRLKPVTECNEITISTDYTVIE